MSQATDLYMMKWWNKQSRTVRFALFFVVWYAFWIWFVQRGEFSRPAYTMLSQWIHTVLEMVYSDADFEVDPEHSGTEARIKIVFTWSESHIERAKAMALERGTKAISVPYHFIKFKPYLAFALPMILLWALILASPYAQLWKKVFDFVLLTIVLGLLLTLRIGLYTLFEMSNFRMGIYELSEGAMHWLNRVLEAWTLGVNVMMVLLVWIAWVVPRSLLWPEWRRWLNRKSKQ